MLDLGSIRACFEGIIPACLATCSADGTPNVTYVSQVEYVDDRHVALTFQFFNKTRENVLANPQAMLLVVHPDNAAMYRIAVRYLRTETAGPLFERMKAKLAAIASQTGMTGVFRLLGSDIYEVTDLVRVDSPVLCDIPPAPNLLPRLRKLSAELAQCSDLDGIIDTTMRGLQQHFAIAHAMLLMMDDRADCLYTVASMGYGVSGVGSEIPLGCGIIGVAAQARAPIRISHRASEYSYQRAMHGGAEGQEADARTVIAPPGLPDWNSQLAVPICAQGRVHGVLFVESPEHLRFGYDEEDALVALASQIAMCLGNHEMEAAGHVEAVHPVPRGQRDRQALLVRFYAANQAVFLNDDYLIKGVAGGIFWKLVNGYQASGRDLYTNRELRMDAELRLPEIGDNLEARIILLQRRLAERGAPIRLEKAGRGRMRLVVEAPLQLQAM